MGYLGAVVHDNDSPPSIDYKFELSPSETPCVKALMDGEELKHGQALPKNTDGTIVVQDETLNNVFFNIILKTQTMVTPGTPLYLRFTKLDHIDVKKVLEFAKIGDELFVEPYNINGESCSPSRYIVSQL